MPLPPLPTRLGSRLSKEELNKAPAPTTEHSDAQTAAKKNTAAKQQTAAQKTTQPTAKKTTKKAAKKAAKKATQKTAQKTAQKAAKKTAKKATKKAAKAAPQRAAAKKDQQQTPALLKTPAKPAEPAQAKQPRPEKDTAVTAQATQKPQTAVRSALESAADEAPKIFVLDTNVLLHDANCLFMFKEHDVFIPMIVLEELDNQKKGLSEVARNARQVSRYLDSIVQGQNMAKGLSLDILGHREAQGKLFLQTQALDAQLPIHLPVGKADNAILYIVRSLQDKHRDKEVILVSKDINIRLKAKALGLPAEDYRHDHVMDDTDLLFKGSRVVDPDFWSDLDGDVETWVDSGFTFYRIRGDWVRDLSVNEFLYTDTEPAFSAQVKEVRRDTAVLSTLRDYGHTKNNLWGITARNREQNFALNLLMNPECDFVSLLGQAGTGKTLLALASSLTQTLETRRYNEIIITRATVPVGDDIGYLPGTEEEKMAPWMGALEDNLEVLQAGSRHHYALSAHDTQHQSALEAIRAHIQIKSLSFMRGRTFLNKFVIIDEAQNLTPKQMKTLITRAGPGTKIVCLGNLAQIDTPYLTEGSSGLTYVVDRFKDWPHAGHITLQQGERSRLADFANSAL
ncbi:MAG TPA: PhoH family protein [Paenalcaligenes sp.]|nr:PhoH family protein [Paenalcaligenes sp.]